MTWSWLPQGIAFVLTFLLFPDGRLLSRRWLVVGWVAVIGIALAGPGWSFDPDTGSEFVDGVNQYAIESLPTDAMYGVGMALVAAAMAASVLALVARYRQSTGVERQQIKWVALAAAIAAAVLPFGAVLWDRAPIVRVLIALALAGLPISMCVAILRYRLYDIDVAISRTVTYGAISVVLAAVYALTAVLLGTIVGQGSAWATAGATLVAAALFRPLRNRVQASVDRRFNRARYDALRRVAHFLDDLRAGRAAPEEVEGLLRGVVRDDRLELRFFLPDIGRYVDSHGRPVIDNSADGRGRFPITRAGVTLGVVVSSTGTEPHPTLISQVLDAGGYLNFLLLYLLWHISNLEQLVSYL